MSLDLNKLANKLDEALSNETSETLTKFLTDKTMSNNKQSSIDWLMQQALEGNIDTRDGSYYMKFPKTAFEQAKAMHKEEIKNAFTNGFISSRGSNRIADEIFYNETFGDESNT